MAKVGWAASWGLLAAMLLVFVREITEFHDPFGPWGDDVRILLRTPWGTTWLAGLGGTSLALPSFRLASRGRGFGWVMATILVVALGAFPALTGHANAGDLRSLTLPADVLHVWAAGSWVGGLAVMLLLERRHRAEERRGAETHVAEHADAEPSLLPVLVPRFSRVAIASVVTLLATGVVGAWIHVGSVDALIATPYGRWLVLKVSIVLVVLVLGGLNWRRLTPRMADRSGPEALRRAALLELALAGVVLAVTAVLVRTPPG